jgi:hypothetical protein
VDLHGYLVWSLLDNFEWDYGYAKRFGMVYVDYTSQQRVLTDSALWYREVIRLGGPPPTRCGGPDGTSGDGSTEGVTGERPDGTPHVGEGGVTRRGLASHRLPGGER